MSISHHQTASGRPLRVSPAWVGAARPLDDDHLRPARDAVWIWSIRRYARIALWALPLGAVLYGWSTLNVATVPGALMIRLAAGWLATIAMIALAGLLAGSRTRRSAVAGLLVGLAGSALMLPVVALPPGAAPAGIGLPVHTVTVVAAATTGAGWLLLGWAVFRSKLVNPADGVLVMLAALSIGAGSYAIKPLPTVGALLLLAAGMGLAWTGSRLIPSA
jgi:Amt family ammonium transporter